VDETARDRESRFYVEAVLTLWMPHGCTRGVAWLRKEEAAELAEIDTLQAARDVALAARLPVGRLLSRFV
jgi:hypothetical protein